MNSNSGLPASMPPSDKPIKRRIHGWPTTRLGWWAVMIAAAAVASLFVLPQITMAYRTTYPIVDTWVMPAILAVLVVATDIMSILAVWRGRERSVLSFLILVLSLLAALLVIMIFIG